MRKGEGYWWRTLTYPQIRKVRELNPASCGPWPKEEDYEEIVIEAAMDIFRLTRKEIFTVPPRA